MDVVALLGKYFPPRTLAWEVVYEHSRKVADKALTIAVSLGMPALDVAFIEEAALLHDIGVCRVFAPDIGCHGNAPYISHGILGREILERENLPRHALVCERHIGVGLTTEDILRQNLPLPHREMIPLTLEERIICFADLFFSKKPGKVGVEKSAYAVRKSLLQFSEEKAAIFDGWLGTFTENTPIHP